MSQPNIRIFYWGFRNNEWNWWEASYRANGVSQVGTGGDGFPCAISGPGGDYTAASIVSDSVFSSKKPFATVPICIVNVGDATLEETNIEIVSHFWAKGNAEFGGGFADTWWQKYKEHFAYGSGYQSSNGFVGYLYSGDDNEDADLWFGEGYRSTDPNGIDVLPASEDASSSKWAVQVSDIYDAEHTGFGFIQNSNGDTILSAQDILNLDTPSLRKGVLGSITDDSNLKGLYARANYRVGSGFSATEGIIDTFIPKAVGTWAADEPNVWRMGHVWKTCRGGSYRRQTPFGDYTIKNITGNSKYNITFTNSDMFLPNRAIKGYIYISLYDKNSMNEGATAEISSGTGLEGVVFGRYFHTIAVFGRYYEI